MPNIFAGIDMEQVEKLARYGHTDKFMAEFFGVSPATWAEWKKKNVKFCEALTSWKNEADEKVERAMFERAIGVTLTEVSHVIDRKTGLPIRVENEKKYPADVNAGMFWLRCRKPLEWRDQGPHYPQGNTLNLNLKVTVQQQDLDERIRQITFGDKLEEALR